LGMYEVSEAAQIITGKADPSAKIIFGTVIDDNLKDEIKITVVATGFEGTPNSNLKSPNNGGFYAPSNFLKSQNKEESAVEAKNNTSDKKKKEARIDEDEELEIPAFLRKKLL